MLRLLPFGLLLLLTGCATSGTTTVASAPNPTSVRVAVGRDAVIGSSGDAFVAPITLDTAIADVWSLIPATYEALEIPVAVINRDSWIVGNPRISASGDFLRQPISTFLSCGSTAAIPEVADRWQVLLSISTVLTPAAGGGTELQTRVIGSAKDPFTSTPARPCSTTGELEAYIASLVRQQLGMTGSEELVLPPGMHFSPDPGTEPALEADPAPGAPPPLAAAPAQIDPASPVMLALGGIAGGALGAYLGSQVGQDCESRCLNARGMAGPLVGLAVTVPVGVHLSNRARGSLPRGILVSAGWAVVGAVVSGIAAEEWGVWAVAPAQLISSVIVERATTGDR